MFGAIIRVAENVRKLNPNKILKETLDNSSIQLDIATLNKEQMFEQGIDSKERTLGEYSPFTIGEKIKKGQRHDHITLKDTGEFYDSIKIQSERKTIIISADMKKPDNDLEVIYPDALGLTNENLQKIQTSVLPIFRTKVLQDILR